MNKKRNTFFLELPKGRRLQEKPLQRAHQTLNYFFFLFWGPFWPAWILIRILNTDQDPLTQFNPHIKHWINSCILISVLQSSYPRG
jgi:hypothetical protein